MYIVDMTKRIYKIILLSVSAILIIMVIALIISADDTKVWADSPLNPSVFGAGVSVTAIGLAFLFSIFPRKNKQTGMRTVAPRQTRFRTTDSTRNNIIIKTKDIINRHFGVFWIIF